MNTTTGTYIERLLNRISLRIGDGEELSAAAKFAELFWSRNLEEDLSARSVEDDAGFSIDSWKMFQDRLADEIQVVVNNPVHARDGWQSTHTVVRVLAPDMPFTVDSVLMALSHDGLVTHHLNNVVFGVDRAASGEITSLHRKTRHHNKELFIHAEIDRVAEQDLPALEERLRRTTSDLKVVVGDFGAMKDRLAHVTAEIRAACPKLSETELSRPSFQSAAEYVLIERNHAR